MLAIKRTKKKSSAPPVAAPGDSLLSLALRRAGAFALGRPGTVALMLLLGGLGVAVSINALWMQSDRHPAPLFHQASLAPQHAVAAAKKASEPPVSAPASASVAPASAVSPSAPQDAEAMLPPSRSSVLAHADAGSPTAAKSLPAKHAERDPLADLIGGTAASPPAPSKQASAKPQLAEKASHASAPANDAIAGLIEQTAKGH